MKKLLLSLLTVMFMMTCFASCTNLIHKHITDEEWSYNGLQHWKDVTCTWNMCKFDIVSYDHVDENGDRICDVCEYQMPQLNVDIEWYTSETHHWYLPEAGENGDIIGIVYGYGEHTDENGDGACDVCEYKASINLNGIAQIVIDYENEVKAGIDRLHEENPQYNYYYNPVEEVHCMYTLEDNASADAIVEKYNMKNVFAEAKVSSWNAIEIICIYFDRDDFTEAMHQKIQQISEEESLIKELSVTMERTWVASYMPKIEYYAEDATVLNCEGAIGMNLGDKNFIIRSKEEYDNYLNYLLEIAEDDYLKEYLQERINGLRDVYDEVFFEENTLIITKMMVISSGSIRVAFNNLYISENKVYVVVRTDVPYICTDDIQEVNYAFQVSKDEVANVNEVITLE